MSLITSKVRLRLFVCHWNKSHSNKPISTKHNENLVMHSFKSMTSNVWYSHPATDGGQTSGRLPERPAPNARPCKASPKINIKDHWERVGEMDVEGEKETEPRRCFQLVRNATARQWMRSICASGCMRRITEHFCLSASSNGIAPLYRHFALLL